MEVFYMSEKPILGILLGNSAGVGRSWWPCWL